MSISYSEKWKCKIKDKFGASFSKVDINYFLKRGGGNWVSQEMWDRLSGLPHSSNGSQQVSEFSWAIINL